MLLLLTLLLVLGEARVGRNDLFSFLFFVFVLLNSKTFSLASASPRNESIYLCCKLW
jgi:hypothetical protein